MVEITVAAVESGRFTVAVREDGSETQHDVTVSEENLRRLGAGYESPKAFVHACFEFLLDREPKESILGSFDVSVIGRYFPDFEPTIRRR